jgi:phage terminase large subunit-like protein
VSALPKWSTACTDWRQRIVKRGKIENLAIAQEKGIRSRESLIPFAPLFPENAEEGLQVFDALRMVDAANQPTMGEVSLPWIREFVAHIFGSYENDTGVRHISEYFMLISKKNGKSTDAAAIMLTALILNWRHEAEYIILSPTIEVAKNSFEPAAAMVRADPELSELLHVQDHIRTITHRHTGATLKVVAAANETVSGKKAAGVLIDELWLFGKMPNAATMIREATGGLAARPEGFIIYLTTQSNEPPAGVFKSKLDYARNVRDGVIQDNRFLSVIFEFPEAMLEAGEHRDPANFYVTNPNMGLSVSETYLIREYEKAQIAGEDDVRDFLAKHLNVEIGLNLRADRWPGAEYWEPARTELPFDLTDILNNCEVVTVGIDGGGLDDLLGLAVCGRHAKTKEWYVWNRAWAHPSVLSRRKDIATKLQDFAKRDQVRLVDQIGVDTDELADIVSQINEAGLLFQVGCDPAGIGAILDAILSRGVDEDKLVSVTQGWRLAGAIKTTERKLAEGVIKHPGMELMAWCVGNAKVKLAGNALVITKQVSGSAKIDPLMATFNAVQLMSLNPEAQNEGYNFSRVLIAG